MRSCQEAEVSKESGLSPPSWLSESEEEAGAGASGLLGWPFYVCKPTVLKPDIFIAENLEAIGNKKEKRKKFTMIILKTKTGI